MTDTAASTPADDVLVAELRRLAALADPVPGGWRDAATVGFAWASIPAAPAGMAYDSRAVPGIRVDAPGLSGSAVREVRYTAGDQAVELDLDMGADKLRLVGRVVPARQAEVAVIWPEGREEAPCDEGGSFRFDQLPRRPLCVVVAGDRPVKTGWIIP
jgi:hypothetical protein